MTINLRELLFQASSLLAELRGVAGHPALEDWPDARAWSMPDWWPVWVGTVDAEGEALRRRGVKLLAAEMALAGAEVHDVALTVERRPLTPREVHDAVTAMEAAGVYAGWEGGPVWSVVGEWPTGGPAWEAWVRMRASWPEVERYLRSRDAGERVSE